MEISQLYKNVGRRKSSTARANVVPGSGNITINGKLLDEYFYYNPIIVKVIQSPLLLLGLEKNFDIIVKVTGGGISGQAQAIKLAIARVLCQLVSKDILFKLKSSGLLTRDCRCKERKKYGLRKARKAPQFSKR